MKHSVFTVAMPEYEIFEAAKKLKEWGYDGIEIQAKRPHGNPMDLDESARSVLYSNPCALVRCIAVTGSFQMQTSE